METHAVEEFSKSLWENSTSFMSSSPAASSFDSVVGSSVGGLHSTKSVHDLLEAKTNSESLTLSEA